MKQKYQFKYSLVGHDSLHWFPTKRTDKQSKRLTTKNQHTIIRMFQCIRFVTIFSDLSQINNNPTQKIQHKKSNRYTLNRGKNNNSKKFLVIHIFGCVFFPHLSSIMFSVPLYVSLTYKNCVFFLLENL